MKLIKYIGKRLNKNGNKVSWGLYKCPFCLQEVERQLSNGKRDKSCGCNQHVYSEERNKRVSQSNKGKKRTEEQKNKYSEVNKGKKLTKITKQKIREARKLQNPPNKGKTGEFSSRWEGGKSFEIYPQEFNKELKQSILERDNYTCQDPNCKGNHKKLHVHHIDYNKKNNNPENLVTLCHSCHMKTNGSRDFWLEFYQNIILSKS